MDNDYRLPLPYFTIVYLRIPDRDTAFMRKFRCGRLQRQSLTLMTDGIEPFETRLGKHNLSLVCVGLMVRAQQFEPAF